MQVWRTFWADPNDFQRFRLDGRRLRSAWTFLHPYWPQVLGYLSLTGLLSAIGVLPALVIQRIVDKALPTGNLTLLTELALVLLVVYVTNSGGVLLQRWVGTRLGSRMTMNLRVALFAHLQHMPLAFFTRVQPGRVQSRLMQDVNGVQALFTDTLGAVVTDSIGLATVLLTMAALDWRVTVAVLPLAPLVLVSARIAGRRNRDLSRRQMNQLAQLSTVVNESMSVSGALLTWVFGQFARGRTQYAKHAGEIRDTWIEVSMLQTWFMTVLTLVGSVAFTLAYLVGGIAVIRNSISVGTVVAIATLVQRVFGPLVDLASVRVNLASGFVAYERALEVLDTPHLVTDRPGARAVPSTALTSVTFDSVSFRYPAADDFSIRSLEAEAAGIATSEPSAWILRSVSFHAGAGTVTAIVGPSGVGKTTLCYLVSRLYDATEGVVRIGGFDVRHIALKSLSGAVGVVSQDPYLFHDTVLENLRFARPTASEEEVMAACRAAHVHHVISALPNGYSTIVGERGYRFSGGEKQRLSIARAVIRDPSILILDEATSHLDVSTEASIQDALAHLVRDRTTIVVAHRLATVQAADQILVLEQGQIVERGRHDALIALGGRYCEMHRLQAFSIH